MPRCLRMPKGDNFTAVSIIGEQDRHPALGIDHGDARIGIAATDDFGILAHPVETIDRRTTDPFKRIAELCAIRRIKTLVLGLPVRMDGSEGDAALKVRAFGDRLRQHIPDLPLVYIDESLTTMSAASKLREAGRNAKQQKAVIDQAAAVEILNTWNGGFSLLPPPTDQH